MTTNTVAFVRKNFLSDNAVGNSEELLWLRAENDRLKQIIADLSESLLITRHIDRQTGAK